VHQRNSISRNRIAAFAASALLFAACSNAGTGTTATPGAAATQTPASTAATTPPSAGASQEAEAYEVELGDAALGKFLTGEDGKTLYLFTPDTATTSACNTGCVDSWPPFTLEADETVKGGDGVAGTFGTITRKDGGTQVTYNGHPLYYFSGDQAAGDTNGQGLNSKWYVVGADGNAIMAKAQASGGKYGY
jgi:predicted lipoprotein with Yx(FWY)xxD motif